MNKDIPLEEDQKTPNNYELEFADRKNREDVPLNDYEVRNK